jgi:hypothetical protein
MIDQELIEQNIKHALHAFANIEPTPSCSLWKIKNIFTDSLIDKIKNYVIANNDSNLWASVQGQEQLNRKKITWHQDTVIEEVHLILEGLTSDVNAMFPGCHKNFLGISLWKDWDGYKMDWHVDNPIIDVSIQLYLFDTAPREAGTVFKIGTTDFLIPYVSNSGYLYVQNENSSLLHKPAIEITANAVRYSLYSIWSNTTKKIADA